VVNWVPPLLLSVSGVLLELGVLSVPQTLLLSAMLVPLARGVAVKVWERSVGAICALQARSLQKSGLPVGQLVRNARKELGVQIQVLAHHRIA